jgi:transcriptional regulator with GAF, ATPase, and Fis domain
VVTDLAPWLARRLADGTPLAISRIGDFPPEARDVRAIAERENIGSVLWVPFQSREGMEGYVVLNTVGRERPWSQVDVEELRLLGQIFANVLERQRADVRLQQAYDEMRALQERLRDENVSLRSTVRESFGGGELVGRSPALRQTLEQVRQVAPTDSTVLLTGETGTGKGLVARAIHAQSPRKDKPFVTVNCAALPESLLESELFGHEKGAFTGAVTRKIGRFEIADRGTLFLDEIGELPPHIQVKLLHFLQHKAFERIGSPQTIEVDVRVIAATNRQLDQMIEAGTFRSDLFYRLGVFPIHVPPLRERRGDIALLLWFFIREFEGRLGKKIEDVPAKEMEALENYHWPGNVREVENIVERAMILATGPTLAVGGLLAERPSRPRAAARTRRSAKESLEEMERAHIVEVLETSGWRIRGEGGAAERLGLKRTTLQSRMKKLGIQRPPLSASERSTVAATTSRPRRPAPGTPESHTTPNPGD